MWPPFPFHFNQAEWNVCIKLKVRFHISQEKAESKKDQKEKKVVMLRPINRKENYWQDDGNGRGHEINKNGNWPVLNRLYK